MVRNRSYHPIDIVGYGCIADFDCCQTFDCKKDKQNSKKDFEEEIQISEKLYGKQDLYLIDHDLYCTEDVRTRFSHVIRCYKPIEIYHIEKTKFYWAVDCLCYKIRRSGNAREDIGLVLEQLIQDEKNLIPVKETLLFKRQYHDEIEKMIDEVLCHHKSSE